MREFSFRCPGCILFTLTLLLAICGGICQAEISCYTNSMPTYPSQSLNDHFGEGGFVQCQAESQCYETLNKVYQKDSAIYTAGCDMDCSMIDPKKLDCKTCSKHLCNNELAKEIKSKSILCFSAVNDKEMGMMRIWCAKDVKTCYWKAEENRQKEKRYYAGCGSGFEFCNDCKPCDTPLCNIPDEMKHLATPAYVASGVDDGDGGDKSDSDKDSGDKGGDKGGDKDSGDKGANKDGDKDGDNGGDKDGDKDGYKDDDKGGGKGGGKSTNVRGRAAFADSDDNSSTPVDPTAAVVLATVLTAAVAKLLQE